MGWGTGNLGSGSSGGLNFQVLGNPQPNNAKENTIWIDTDVKITSWIFSATEPEAPADGKDGPIWIATGTSSNIEFNALKKNAIQVYPISAKQYISGAWVDVTAMSFQDGKWVEWAIPGLLYEPDNENISLTGGWADGTPFVWGSGYVTPGNLTVTRDSSGITAKQTVKFGNSALYMKNRIDLTKYNTLYFSGSIASGASTYCRLMIWTDFGEYVETNKVAELNGALTDGTYTIDISSLSGLYRIGFFIFSIGSEITMRKMWLE